MKTILPYLRGALLLVALLLQESAAFQSSLRSLSFVDSASPRKFVLVHPRQKSCLTAASPPSNNNNNNNDTPSNYGEFVDLQRRRVWKKTVVQFASVLTAGTAIALLTRPAWASQKSRTEGYAVQKSQAEWKEQLSPMQYFVLREGGTERPGFSILESEKRAGTFKCAACDTPLFQSSDKFNSGTGWPSFARGLEGVEIENINPIQANLAGAELRCRTCGGHLGDVFNDGFLFVGTEAAITGKRFCIDGAALVFYPQDGGSPPLRGDVPAAKKESKLASLLEPPKVKPRDGVAIQSDAI